MPSVNDALDKLAKRVYEVELCVGCGRVDYSWGVESIAMAWYLKPEIVKHAIKERVLKMWQDGVE